MYILPLSSCFLSFSYEILYVLLLNRTYYHGKQDHVLSVFEGEMMNETYININIILMI